MRSWWLDIAWCLTFFVPRQVPAAVTRTSYLICCCSMAAAVILALLNVPPTLFGAFCRCFCWMFFVAHHDLPGSHWFPAMTLLNNMLVYGPFPDPWLRWDWWLVAGWTLQTSSNSNGQDQWLLYGSKSSLVCGGLLLISMNRYMERKCVCMLDIFELFIWFALTWTSTNCNVNFACVYLHTVLCVEK